MDDKTNGKLPPYRVVDLIVLGAAIIKRRDKGVMTDESIRKFVNGCIWAYDLTLEDAVVLEVRLKEKRDGCE